MKKMFYLLFQLYGGAEISLLIFQKLDYDLQMSIC